MSVPNAIMDTMNTPFDTKALILSNITTDKAGVSEAWDNFIAYNNLGLPLAYAYVNGWFDNPSEPVVRHINQTFDRLVAGFGKDDTGFETVEEIEA
jgi:hypothetical protein